METALAIGGVYGENRLSGLTKTPKGNGDGYGAKRQAQGAKG